MKTEDLVQMGFGQPQAEALMANEFFRAHVVDAARFKTKLAGLAVAYGVSDEKIRQMALAHPQMAGHDTNILQDILEFFGAGHGQAVKKAVRSFLPFAGYGLSRAVREAAAIYGDEAAVRKATLSFPRFVSYDHARVERDAVDVYGMGNRPAVKKAVISHPPFVTLDHGRVVWQAGRLGRMAGLKRWEVVGAILAKPPLADYSPKRHLAAFDVARALEKEGLLVEKSEMVKIFLKHYYRSPYVPGTDKLRISQARKLGITAEPPLMAKMRSVLLRQQADNGRAVR